MKINNKVLRLLAKEAKTDSIYNLLSAVIQHVTDKYDCNCNNDDKVNNILGIITGDELVNPWDINLDKVKEHSDWLYKNDKYKVTKQVVESIDNISCSDHILYKYIDASNNEKEYDSSFDISYIEFPDIIKQ